ncbi:hypothetical protein PVAP13_7KG313703 [Panicum virgatum]|uniref:Uncharacterized protein n=1 Tax=Panicum virgatum TaxID=38727 RepID=A0A8T0QMM6_PANVG|nr:hypothetical protein PVAP13_7KG313703 [Panicum virgatum]
MVFLTGNSQPPPRHGRTTHQTSSQIAAYKETAAASKDMSTVPKHHRPSSAQAHRRPIDPLPPTQGHHQAMMSASDPCSDHSYELPLRRNLLVLRDLLDVLRFVAGVLLDRIGVVSCQRARGAASPPDLGRGARRRRGRGVLLPPRGDAAGAHHQLAAGDDRRGDAVQAAAAGGRRRGRGRLRDLLGGAGGSGTRGAGGRGAGRLLARVPRRVHRRLGRHRRGGHLPAVPRAHVAHGVGGRDGQSALAPRAPQ